MIETDFQVRILLDNWSKKPQTSISKLTAEMVRKNDKEVQKLQEPLESVESIKDYIATTSIGDITVRVYTPNNLKKDKKTFPVFIFFHGGGFVIGSESYESPIRAMTNQSRCIVCAVQYSLAPENKFPVAVNQAIAASKWIIQNVNLFNGDANRIAIGGDSSGGNLATIAVLSNQNKQTYKCLILIYPMLDATCSQPSVEEFSNGYGFTKEKIKWYFNQYLPKGVDKKQILISPLFSKTLQGFPKTYIASAECDPLRDEAELFGAKLEKSGVTVFTKRYKGMIHGFFQMSGVLNQGKRLIEDIAKQLQLNLHN